MTGSPGGKLRAYWELGKPRLSLLAVFAVVAGVYMGWPAKGTHPPADLLRPRSAPSWRRSARRR
jgi:heme O synthase-like polyprenyltransferase